MAAPHIQEYGQMHTLNPFGNRVTAYPVKALAILPNRGWLPASHTLSNLHMPNTRSLAVEEGDLLIPHL